jgi:hypothetical protein
MSEPFVVRGQVAAIGRLDAGMDRRKGASRTDRGIERQPPATKGAQADELPAGGAEATIVSHGRHMSCARTCGRRS